MSAATGPDWSAVRALFDEVQALPPEQRQARLAAPGLAPATLAEVRSLLAHAEHAADFLDAGPAGAEAFLAATPERRGQHLGPWRLVEPLGRGGMGEVWLAQRADGAFEGEAAIKLLRAGLDGDALLARFARERQALARLNHPNIARLLDAGRSADGLPYVVMERAQGLPLDQACADWPLARRLAVFLQLADAVAHAHRQLLVHRDLKPGNVLVDAAGQVKLLDFGIAHALDAGATGSEQAALTRAGERPFTPYYASPEQVRGEPVGTATDVYALGVLLYQLLTGVRPYARGPVSALEAARAVVDDPPTRPSALSPAEVGEPDWPARRRQLEGDLDNIVLKALAKKPAERYPSVEAFAADVSAHLAGKPVSARPPTWAYLASRFVRRHRWGVASAGAAVLALVAGLGLALWQADRAERARADAERRFAQVRQLTQQLVFRYHDQLVNLPGTLAVRDALLADATGYLQGLLADGEPDPALAREVALAFHRLAVLQGEQYSPGQERLADARRNLDRALALLPRVVGTAQAPVDAPASTLREAAEVWMTDAMLQRRAARLAPAAHAMEQARGLIERALARAPGDVETAAQLATAEARLGQLLGGNPAASNLGRVAEARRWLSAAAQRLDGLARRHPADVERVHQAAWGQQGVAAVALLAGDLPAALAAAQAGLAGRDAALAMRPGDAHLRHQAAIARAILASILAHAGRHADARLHFDDAVARMRAELADDPDNATARRDLGLLRLVDGRLALLAGEPERARAPLQALLDELPAQPGDAYLANLRAQAAVAAARAWRGADPGRALALAEQAAAELAPLAQAAPDDAATGWALAEALGEQAAALAALPAPRGGPGAAAERARQALERWRAASPDGEPPGLYRVWVERDRGLAREGA